MKLKKATKYGSLFVPVIYWLIYLAIRFTYNGVITDNGVVYGYGQLFFQSVRYDGVFIICSLLMFYLLCIRVDIGDREFLGILLFCIVSFHLVALIVTFLICLWNGALLWDVIFIGQMGISTLLLFFIPFLTFYYGD